MMSTSIVGHVALTLMATDLQAGQVPPVRTEAPEAGNSTRRGWGWLRWLTALLSVGFLIGAYFVGYNVAHPGTTKWTEVAAIASAGAAIGTLVLAGYTAN